jgi:hypothetical protein
MHGLKYLLMLFVAMEEELEDNITMENASTDLELSNPTRHATLATNYDEDSDPLRQPGTIGRLVCIDQLFDFESRHWVSLQVLMRNWSYTSYSILMVKARMMKTLILTLW